MPYYSYGYGYDSANLIYLILLIPVLLLSLYAQAAVSGNFSRYSKVTNRRGLTGAQAAAGVLRAHGITDVGIARCSGKLTDHYDPRNNTVFLSDSVYDAATVAAVGVAAHEVGHAIQHATGYSPIKVRNAIVPAVNVCNMLSMPIILLGIILSYNQTFVDLGIILFSATVLFQLITLPVEFNGNADRSHRLARICRFGQMYNICARVIVIGKFARDTLDSHIIKSVHIKNFSCRVRTRQPKTIIHTRILSEC